MVTVGFDSSWAPFDYASPDGKHQGISAEILKLIANYTGLKFKPVSANWDNIVKQFESGNLDMLSAIIIDKDREKFGTYTTPYYQVDNFIFVKQNNKDIQKFKDLFGKTVAIPKGYTLIIKLKKQYPRIKILETSSVLDALFSVLNGQADATIESQAIVNYTMQQNSIAGIKGLVQNQLESSELAMLTNKNQKILHSIIQKALDVVLQKDIIAIKQKFFIQSASEQNNTVVLTDAEQTWLNQHPLLRFTGDPNWLPYEAFDENGKYIGIVAEYLKLITSMLNIKVKKIPTKSWEESVAMAKNNEVDILSETTGSELKSHLIFTHGYLDNPIVIIMHTNNSYVETLDAIKDKKIAVIKDYGYVAKIKHKYPLIKFHEVETIQEGLTSVSTGKVDALLCTMALGSYTISELGLNNIKVVGKTEFSMELGLGVRKDYAPLVPILNKAIAKITNQDRLKIKNNWIKHKYTERVNYTLIWQISGIFLVFAIFAGYWTHKINRIKNKTKRNEIFLNTVLDSQSQIIITTDVSKNKIITANRAFLNLMEIEELSQFTLKHNCICDLFDSTTSPDEYLHAQMPSGVSWNEYMKSNPDKQHKAIINWMNKQYIFSVSLADLSSLDDSLNLVVFNDITVMENATKELHAQKEKLESISKQLSKYLSPQIYDMIFSGKQDVSISSKRKKLTIFFSDIVGFTPMTEELESEELTQLINNYMTEMAKIALKHGATIDKYIGDAIVIFFGDPESKGYKQDALSCIEMAMEMQEKNKEIRAGLVDEGIVKDFQMRIGITTGYCTVGNFGSDDRMDYTIIGGNVNLASRLEASAPPSGILISHETYSLVKEKIMCVPQDPIKVKGISKPVDTYLVINPI